MPVNLSQPNFYSVKVYNGEIPKDIPTKVKEILGRKIIYSEPYTVGDRRPTLGQLLTLRAEMARDIIKLGYDPKSLGLNLDLEQLNKTLAAKRANKVYSSYKL